MQEHDGTERDFCADLFHPEYVAFHSATSIHSPKEERRERRKSKEHRGEIPIVPTPKLERSTPLIHSDASITAKAPASQEQRDQPGRSMPLDSNRETRSPTLQKAKEPPRRRKNHSSCWCCYRPARAYHWPHDSHHRSPKSAH
jgi:hypothetical protein